MTHRCVESLSKGRDFLSEFNLWAVIRGPLPTGATRSSPGNKSQSNSCMTHTPRRAWPTEIQTLMRGSLPSDPEKYINAEADRRHIEYLAISFNQFSLLVTLASRVIHTYSIFTCILLLMEAIQPLANYEQSSSGRAQQQLY